MPKLKTKKAIRKRVKVTGSGKVLSQKVNRRHLMADRHPAKKRQFRGWRTLGLTQANSFKRGLPYGS